MGNQEDSNQYTNTVEAAIAEQMARLCEGYIGPDAHERKTSVNIFGRQLITDGSADPGFIIGLSLTGLRSACLIENSSARKVRGYIKSAARQHLPIVFHSTGSRNKWLKYSAVIHLHSSTPQQVIDFSVLAHRIAELSLVPCVHTVYYEGNLAGVKTLADDEIKTFLGAPDDIIDTPTPAQEIIFGARRRRLPHYFSLDQPMQLGVAKDEYAKGLEKAAKNSYFFSHLPEIIDRVFTEFATLTGRQYDHLLTHNNKGSKCLIVSDGGLFDQLKSFSAGNPQLQAGIIEQIVRFPLISDNFKHLGTLKQPVTLLQHIDNENQETYKSLSPHCSSGVISVIYTTSPSTDGLLAVCDNMKSENPRNNSYLGFNFTKNTELPKHQVLLQQISRAYPDINEQVLASSIDAEADNKTALPDTPANLPLTVRQYKDGGVPYSRLNRFYDDTALFYAVDNQQEIVADPFQALPTVPPVASGFSGVARDRQALPVFKSELCTGCGECFIQCPYSAIPPIAIGIESLLNSGMQAVNASGGHLVALLPMMKNLAKTATKIIKQEPEKIKTVDDFLMPSFNSLMEQMKIQGDKLTDLQKEIALIQEQIGSFPTALTDTFFNFPEAVEKGSGELFSLAIDSHACTGCGICSQVCDEEALVLAPQGEEMLKAAGENLKIWEKLPDTTSYTINRLLEDDDYDSFAAVMLSRSIYLSMTGSSRSEQVSFSKTMMHIVSSATESIMQPRYAAQEQTLKSIIQKLSDNIHDTLSNTIPKEHFEGIQKALQSVNGARAPFEEVMAKAGNEARMQQISVPDVARKIDLLHNLRSLDWLIQEGPTGTGRARFSLALCDSEGIKWANQYPANCFTAPAVMIWDNAMVDLSIGLVHGHLRYLLDNIKLLRRADLEISNKYVPAKHDREIAGLGWADLTDQEIAIIPPVFIVGDEGMLTSALWAGLAKLMQLQVPVKVIILDSMQVKPGDTGKLSRSHAELLSLIALKSTFVFQGGLGNRQALFSALIKGISTAKPAFYRLMAPNPNHFINDFFRFSDISDIAQNSRSFPTIEFDPAQPARYLNAMLNLKGNPEVEKYWQLKKLTYSADGEDSAVEFGVTWADWAYTQKEWADHFRLITDSGEMLVAVSEYVQAAEDNNSAIPVIYRLREGKLMTYAVSQSVVAMVRASMNSWDMLREIAGELTAFPDKLKKQVRAELEAVHQQDLAALNEDFQAQLESAEQRQMESVRLKLKNKLIELANRKAL